ncbi:mitochondrial inner membrane signal peptidase protein [Strigomonas culicis]|uniref:Mitochondrial inner membrane signal peptidase protein n=1 Tax=Strigomonas culicis TaxID=28005 RepID=S9U9T2_9TRYP|nr:mitochondrial inner membrane signal peptidase protein [Strigomonas culicis]|eukprot:EPY25514.1 mitochondrial inner membrane signal peptidase protein [Strigomonas culicis]
MPRWWSSLRNSAFKDVPFVLLGVFIGWNCDVVCGVKGVSMEPTLTPGEYICFIPHSLLFLKPWMGLPLVKVGDVVVVKISKTLSVCKRVTRITSNAEAAHLWGKEYFENISSFDYAQPAGPRASDEATGYSESSYYDRLGALSTRSTDWDECISRFPRSSHFLWLEGDNAPHSHDSRACGAVPAECLRGLVLATVWPHFRVVQ